MSDLEQQARKAANTLGLVEGQDIYKYFMKGFHEAQVYAERQLWEPMNCEHPKACLVSHVVSDIVRLETDTDSDGGLTSETYCSACRRDQELREVLQSIVNAERAAVSARNWSLSEYTVESRAAVMNALNKLHDTIDHAEALLASPKEAK